MSKLVVHATTLSLLSGGAWKGVLILGPSGVGKSDMAVRAVEKGLMLICDDHTALWSSGGHLYATPAVPDPTAFRTLTRLHLVVLAQSEGPRAPEGEITAILGHNVPTLRLNPREASAVPRLITRLRSL
ncbi:HPr kinase [Asticcacaulis biprosthecium C19]|uniref:HPr kinase n=1 Tax=Asticcacaulis biprosthecium C19 TaxID=715226 RepID=F4QIR9_9CAUL|nr:aldolase [Asticcacaulis biprosthecium]EGF91828.1 HPr kinase [Asticcacaulis biprosthecium C19]